MTKVPLKWGNANGNGKVAVNPSNDVTFTSDSAALTVYGDVVSDNITAIGSDMSAQATQISSLDGRVTTLENALPSLSGGVVKATTAMSIASGLPSDFESGTGKFYSNGIAIPNGGGTGGINAVWFKGGDTGSDAEIGMGNNSGVLYLRKYNSSNQVAKQVTLLDENGDATFPSRVNAATFSGNLSGTASDANTVGGYAVSTTDINNGANKIVRTDANGNTQFGLIATSASDLGTAAMNKIYCSDGSVVKYKSVNNFINALNLADNFLGYKVKVITTTQAVSITSSWGSLYEGHVDLTFSNLGMTSIEHAWVSAWSVSDAKWEIYPSIFTITPSGATIYLIRGEISDSFNVKINLLIFGH